MIYKLPKIELDWVGFDHLVDFAVSTEKCLVEQIDIDMSETTWFAADMCAAFGAVLYKLGSNLNNVRLHNILPDVERILSKNGFLCTYGREAIPDTWGTTIPYQRFETKDERYFGAYVEQQLMQHPGIPRMTQGLRKRLRESIFEVFSNAVIHSETRLGIFSCGQFFPNRDRLMFSIADLGIGIGESLRRKLKLELPHDQAIEHALKEGTTTKSGPIPGGLGLKLLRQFIELNSGAFTIVSGRGYWQLLEKRVSKTELSGAFPGTVVTLVINTADTYSQTAASKISPSDIF